VEFALVASPFLMLLVGTVWASIVVSVNASSAAAAQSYAQSLYSGVSSPTFTASTPSCGHQVNATLSLVLNAGMAKWTVPLSATACFP
jgi:hypothetical protein